MRRNNTFTVAVSFFAIGAVLAFLATIQVVQDRSSDQQGLRVGGLDGLADDLEDLGLGDDFAIDPETGELITTGGGGAAGGGGQAGTEGSGGGGSGSGSNVGGGGAGGPNSGQGGDIACAPGRNGGATAPGVTATEIKLGATVAESDFAEYFLGEVRHGMNAVVKKVNASGGICGRLLKVVYKDDGWDPEVGRRNIETLIDGDKVFALAVSPSSEGVNAASRRDGGAYFRNKGVPVVGADGLNVSQFQDPYIFPVAAATITTVDVMMKHAWDQGARNPVIVFGNTYRFGVEGAFAANAAYRKLSGGDIPGYKNPLQSGGGGCDKRFCGVAAASGQYGGPSGAVNSACNETPKCDYMILLLEPATAQQWMGVPQVKEPRNLTFGIGAPQPLFTYSFGTACKDKCNEMRVWTGYNPPIESFAAKSAVAAYVKALKDESASADRYNQFTLGGYVGMQALVKALEQVGPNLTREGLVATLNSMAPVDTGLTTTPLAWRSGARHANKAAHWFQMQSKNNKFTGWTESKKPPIQDPWLGQHTGSG